MRAGEVLGTVQAISIIAEGPELFDHARQYQCVRFEIKSWYYSNLLQLNRS